MISTRQDEINAQRSALFSLGEAATEAMWDAVADAQQELNDEIFTSSGYMRGV